jgi:ATP-dependent DNA ligase
VERLADLPDGTVVDGELVAIDDSGRPDFHLLQNFRAQAARIHYYIFDLLCRKDRDLTRLPLIERRELLKSLVMKANPPRLKQRSRSSQPPIAAFKGKELDSSLRTCG